MPNKFTSCIEAINTCDLELLNSAWSDLKTPENSGFYEDEEEETVFSETILTYAIKSYQKACDTDNEAKYKELVLFLLRNGASVDEPNARGSYPIHVACERNPDIEIIQHVSAKVKNLVNQSQLDSHGNTALYYAVHFPKSLICEVVTILLDCGISPDVGAITPQEEFQCLNPEYQDPEVAKLLGVATDLA